jgi:hypothetical protein
MTWNDMEPVISELTQWSGSLTRLASDLGQARQKVHLYNTFLGGLRQQHSGSSGRAAAAASGSVRPAAVVVAAEATV